MSQISKIIENKLSVLEHQLLLIENESHMHSGPATDSHFKVTMVSDEFDSMRLVARHQKIYALLADELAGPVHALALHLFSVGEWKDEVQVPDSPLCQGGSKQGDAKSEK